MDDHRPNVTGAVVEDAALPLFLLHFQPKRLVTVDTGFREDIDQQQAHWPYDYAFQTVPYPVLVLDMRPYSDSCSCKSDIVQMFCLAVRERVYFVNDAKTNCPIDR